MRPPTWLRPPGGHYSVSESLLSDLPDDVLAEAEDDRDAIAGTDRACNGN